MNSRRTIGVPTVLKSDQFREVYVVCRALADDDHYTKILDLIGAAFDRMDEMSRMTLNMGSILENLSKQQCLDAKQVYRLMRHRLPKDLRKRGEDEFYPAVR